MQSFVVQNFFKIYPINEKTKKQLPSILLKYNNYLLVNIMGNLNVTLKLLHTKYFQPFSLFTHIFEKITNTVTNNLLKSIKYWLLQKTLTYLNQPPQYKYLDKKNFLYTNTTKSLTGVSYKTNLNKLLLFILSVISGNYMCNTNFFKVNTSTLPLNTNFYFFTFINLFYFKTRSY